MPHSLRAKLSGLRYKGILEDKDYKRLCHALDLEKAEQEPCDNAISKTEVRKFVEYIQSIKDNHNENRTPINYGTICDIVIEGWNLLNLLSVNPQEKTGHWIITSLSNMAYCSECDYLFRDVPASIVKHFKYCPNCGAKMD